MKLYMVVLILAVATSATAQAGDGRSAIGAMIGDPTGVSGKYDLNESQAIDGGIGWSLGAKSGTEIHGDFLQFMRGGVTAGDTDIDFYYGIGARLITINGGYDRGKIAIGPRAPLGLLHRLADPSVEFFGEAALIFDLSPGIAADIDLGVGARYRF